MFHGCHLLNVSTRSLSRYQWKSKSLEGWWFHLPLISNYNVMCDVKLREFDPWDGSTAAHGDGKQSQG
jgi:hypothetical protein